MASPDLPDDSVLRLLGRRIRIYRSRQRQVHVDRAWTQEDLAVAIGSDKAHVNRIECGRQRATVDTLNRICDALALPWIERRRLLALAGYLVAPPVPGGHEIAEVARRVGRIVHDARHPACLVDQSHRLWDVNDLFASAFLNYADRDACLADVRGRRWVEILSAGHPAGQWLRGVLPDFAAFARRHLLVLHRAMQPGEASSAEEEALLNDILEDRVLCALWLGLSAHLPKSDEPDYIDHQSLELRHPALGSAARIEVWHSVLASDERFRVVHLAPGNDHVAARFAKLAPVERDAGCTVPVDTTVGRMGGRGDVRRFPSRPITLTLPWAAGGATDVGARILAPLLGRELGQAVVVANCDEAQTPEAFARLAEMPADGYHLLFINEPSFEMAVGRPAHAMQPAAFRLLASQAFDPIGAFVRADSPYATLGDLLRDARSRERMLTVGTSGPRTPAHLGAVMLEERTGLRFRYRHYRGSLEHVARFLAGQTDVAFFGSGITLPALRAGELRALAMFTPERFHLLPEVPTTGDAGLASLVLASTRGLWVPAGVPAPVFRTLQAAVVRALRDDAHVCQMHASGLGVIVMEGRDYEQYQDAQSTVYGRFARTLAVV